MLALRRPETQRRRFIKTGTQRDVLADEGEPAARQRLVLQQETPNGICVYIS
jgi:hypothetical protein